MRSVCAYDAWWARHALASAAPAPARGAPEAVRQTHLPPHGGMCRLSLPDREAAAANRSAASGMGP